MNTRTKGSHPRTSRSPASAAGLVFLAGCLVCALACSGNGSGEPTPSSPPAPQESRLTLLHTNDMHSELIGFGPNAECTPLSTGDDTTIGGIVRIAGKVKEIRAERDARGIPTLLVDAGDFMMGSAFELLRGAVELGAMNAMNYDVITLGNHEFDWGPSGTATILSHAQGLPVVASNLVFSQDDPRDDALADLYEQGAIRPYLIKTVSNGLRVGFFGLLGKDAVSVAPFASPVTFSDQAEAARAMVASLRAAGVDLIVCLSHSGLQEDSALAATVPGIDVIVSGHTHETTEAPLIVGETLIVQAGSYARSLGVLDLDLSEGRPRLLAYELVDIDDTIEGDPQIQAALERSVEEVDEQVLRPMGWEFLKPAFETPFDLVSRDGQESTLGNLVTDAMRWMVDRYEYDPEDPSSQRVDFAIESHGVIRDDILAGTSGIQSFADVFRVLPLGFGLDGAVGYPMLTIYVTAEEIKKAMEVITTVYPLKGSDYWLNVSGLRVEYAKRGIPFFLVRNIYVGDDEHGYSPEPLDTSPANPRLYKVAVNYYVAQFIRVIGEYTYGILTIVPKDKNGASYLDKSIHPGGLDEARVDTDPVQPGIQELQEWKGLLDYVASFDDTDGDGIPNVPERYRGPTGRITQVSCFIATAVYGSPREPRVEALRMLRDRLLQKSCVGRELIEFYYDVGKPAADWMAGRPRACAVVRLLLLPFVGAARVVLPTP